MENKVLAVIEGFEISDKDLEVLIKRYPEDKRQELETEEAKKQLLEQTIGFELLNNFGKEIGLDKTEQYKLAVESYAKELLIQMTMDKVLSEVTITADDVRKYYDENKEKFMDAPTISAKHILVETEEEVKNIKAEIDSGKITFEDAAKKYSTCPSNAEGGSLGVFGQGMMVPEFEDVAFNSEVNVVTEPVKTQFGYHLILVDAKNDTKAKEFEEVKETIHAGLTQEAQYKKYKDILKELEGKYKVERM